MAEELKAPEKVEEEKAAPWAKDVKALDAKLERLLADYKEQRELLEQKIAGIAVNVEELYDDTFFDMGEDSPDNAVNPFGHEEALDQDELLAVDASHDARYMGVTADGADEVLHVSWPILKSRDPADEGAALLEIDSDLFSGIGVPGGGTGPAKWHSFQFDFVLDKDNAVTDEVRIHKGWVYWKDAAIAGQTIVNKPWVDPAEYVDVVPGNGVVYYWITVDLTDGTTTWGSGSTPPDSTATVETYVIARVTSADDVVTEIVERQTSDIHESRA